MGSENFCRNFGGPTAKTENALFAESKLRSKNEPSAGWRKIFSEFFPYNAGVKNSRPRQGGLQNRKNRKNRQNLGKPTFPTVCA